MGATYADVCSPTSQSTGSDPGCVGTGKDPPSSQGKEPSPQQRPRPAAQGADPAGVGLNLADLLQSGRQGSAAADEPEVQGFSWGTDVSEPRAGPPTAKAK